MDSDGEVWRQIADRVVVRRNIQVEKMGEIDALVPARFLPDFVAEKG